MAEGDSREKEKAPSKGFTVGSTETESILRANKSTDLKVDR